MGFFKFIGLWALGILGMLLFFFIKELVTPPTENEKARSRQMDVIEYCWKDYERKSHDASTKLFIASACEKFEEELKKLPR